MTKSQRSSLKAVSMQTMVFIGTKLKDLRLRRAMSQRKLAEASGMSQRAIVDLETNRREPHPSTLGKLAEALGVEPSKLFDD
jgi:transcriptional regulator with XRE-family HTH domain